ncbi:MAG: hypothetical protein M0Q38_12110, partial [Bacteroidales bacterium]|nr:hypothetical protein [Bacteroidales bacterium]
MKKVFLIFGMVFLMFSVAAAQDLSLDEIMSRHYNAMGYQNLQKANTIIMTGTMVQQDAMPVKIFRMRPDKYLMESDIQDITSYQGYDGQTAWWTTPWTGNPKPQVMPEDRARDIKSKADFDGLLYNWKTKGHTLELTGRDTVETFPVYKLKITRNDNGIEYLFIDTIKFITLKRLYYRMIRGQEVAVENYYRDYRPVQGVMFSYIQDTHFGGQPYNSLQFDSIVLNKPVDE